jgi:Methyltransferase domain
MDQGGMGSHRHALLAGLAGEVIEIGAGDGKNFPHYPTTVTRVQALEPEPRLRHLAQPAAGQGPVPIDVTDNLAERLPAPDASLDAAVFAFTLCTISDPMRRCARPSACSGRAGRYGSSSTSAPAPAASPVCSACWMPASGRRCSAAATWDGTPPPRSSTPGSPSTGSTDSCAARFIRKLRAAWVVHAPSGLAVMPAR